MTNLAAYVGGSVPVGIAAWLGCLVFMLALGLQVAKIVREIRGRPEASEVQAEADEKFVTKRDCERLHHLVEQKMASVDTMRSQDQKEFSESRGKLYTQIATVRQEMGDMERRLNSADELRTLELHKRLNEILESVGELRGTIHKVK